MRMANSEPLVSEYVSAIFILSLSLSLVQPAFKEGNPFECRSELGCFKIDVGIEVDLVGEHDLLKPWWVGLLHLRCIFQLGCLERIMMRLQLRVREIAASHGHQVERRDLLVWCHVLPSEVWERVVLMELQVLVELLSLLNSLCILRNLLVLIWVLLLQFAFDFEVDGLNQFIDVA